VRHLTGSVLATIAAALVLGGCGADHNPADPGATPKSESLPACHQIWVKGRTLPKDYQGCVDSDGVLQVSEVKQCPSSDGALTTYHQDYFALLGQKIDRGVDSTAYQQTYAICFGTS